MNHATWQRFAFALSGSIVVSGCGPAPLVRDQETTSFPDAVPIAPATACSVTTYREVAVERSHVPACSELAYSVHPPSSGTHYDRWAAFQVYDQPVPWGFLVHALEHGAVVIAHHCDGRCEDVVPQLETLAREWPADPLCRGDGPSARIIVVPDPSLPVPLAVVAWEHTYLATCFDPSSLRAFVVEHYGMGVEATCAPGLGPSSAGWCPP